MPLEPTTPSVLSIDGEIDLASRDAVTALLAPFLNGPAPDVVLLTHGVTFIDCAGLAPIHRAALVLRRWGGRLWLPAPAPALVRLALLTRCADELGLTTARATTTLPPRELATTQPATTTAPAAPPPPHEHLPLQAIATCRNLR
ncbi:STAS domain-containing protein [Streptomyces sp. NP160]|uniref:STAS domain-containing protein n=1 Tax=Streptomyces sp. NP160 TaxID=2586637 RepID=UPI001118715C|nr:STAS domain-containing protein [Streptomyces sp. NP160]TNM67301.1 STAS domain-containing protein [Streptomyces sp. NP160]